MGIRTDWIDALTFGLGSGIAGLGRRRPVADRQRQSQSRSGYIIDSFLVVVFGGVGNLWGTLVGAFSLGIANKFLEPLPAPCSARSRLVVIILFIQKRPRGLFALKGRAVEA